MTTLKQIEANRRNAKLSTGPRTEIGKAKSRANAVNHGLTCYTVIPEDVEESVADMLAELAAIYSPTTEIDAFHLQQAAIQSVRVSQAFLQENELTKLQIHRAEIFWNDDRRLDAAKLLEKLPKNPERYRMELERTKQGCDLMIERWEFLQDALETGGSWTPAQLSVAQDLMGIQPEFRCEDLSGLTTVDSQLECTREQIKHLGERRTKWLTTRDDIERDHAERGFAFPSQEIWRIRRYEGDARRQYEKAMKHLETHCRKAKPGKSSRGPTKVVEPAPVAPPAPVAAAEPKPSEAAKATRQERVEPVASVPAKPKGNAEHRKKRAHRDRIAARRDAKAALCAK